MGVKFNREYQAIIHDLVQAIGLIQDCHDAFEMSAEEWIALEDAERIECVRTLADDMFYGLGQLPKLDIGSGRIEYDSVNHLIKVYPEPKVVHVVKLI
jgi:hypothetical protein